MGGALRAALSEPVVTDSRTGVEVNEKAVLNASWVRGAFTLTAAKDALQASGWRVSGDTHRQLIAERGSRVRLRLLGVLFKISRNNMPVQIVVTDSGRDIHAVAYPNPGWYLVRFNLAGLYAANARPGIETLNELMDV